MVDNLVVIVKIYLHVEIEMVKFTLSLIMTSNIYYIIAFVFLILYGMPMTHEIGLSFSILDESKK